MNGKVKLILLFIVSGVLCGKGVYPTYKLWRKCVEVEKRLKEENIGKKPEVFPSAGENEAWISNGRLLDKFGKPLEKEGVKVVRFVPLLIRGEGRWEWYAGELILSGAYVPLLNVLNRIEENAEAYRVVSVNFGLWREIGSPKEEVRMSVILQQLEKRDKEE